MLFGCICEQVPSLQLMLDFCLDAEKFLQADADHVIAVHCKAGKGRTGMMVAAYLLYTVISLTYLKLIIVS